MAFKYYKLGADKEDKVSIYNVGVRKYNNSVSLNCGRYVTYTA